MIRIVTALIPLLISAIGCYGQFLPNSIGVVYLINETATSYQLTIVLPLQWLEKAAGDRRGGDLADSKIDFRGDIIFFDKQGELLTLHQPSVFHVQLWCDNDGGEQYRPTLETLVKKEKLKRKIKGIPEIQNIVCFVVLSRNALKVDKPDRSVSSDIKLEGDYNGDGQIDCFLWTYYDEAENCDGLPVNHLGINLQVEKKYFELRCCGP